MEDFRLFLPKFLSATFSEELFAALKSFPDNIDSRFFTDYLKDKPILFQGDGIRDLPLVDFNNRSFQEAKTLIVSNTCDTDPANTRQFASYATYAPIYSLTKWESLLKSKKDSSSHKAIDDHINAIRSQKVTQFFYLPKKGDFEESFVRLDTLFSIPTTQIPSESIASRRIFTLSNYGFYVLLFKLSLHFSRVQDGVDRNIEQIP